MYKLLVKSGNHPKNDVLKDMQYAATDREMCKLELG
jgi:hypothetical protein